MQGLRLHVVIRNRGDRGRNEFERAPDETGNKQRACREGTQGESHRIQVKSVLKGYYSLSQPRPRSRVRHDLKLDWLR